MNVQAYWKGPNLGRSFLKINYPMIKNTYENFICICSFGTTFYWNLIMILFEKPDWIQIILRCFYVVRFMTIYIFIFLQFELCNKSLRYLIQIPTLSGRNVFYFSSGWKCELFILIRQILQLSMVIIGSIVKKKGTVVKNILKSHLLYWYQIDALFFKGKNHAPWLCMCVVTKFHRNNLPLQF